MMETRLMINSLLLRSINFIGLAAN